MTDFETTINADIDDSVEKLFSDDKKAMAELNAQALINKSNSKHLGVNLNTSISSSFDSIDVNKMSKGAITTALTALGTSAEIDCRGFNSVLLHCAPSVSSNISIQGALVSGGTFADCYDGSTQMAVSALATNRAIIFRGIPDYIKIIASANGTYKVQPLNM